MIKNFDIEIKLFEGQVHERDQFSVVDFQDNNYKGIYHNGEITWFHPHPQQNLEEKHLTNIEEKIHERMQNQLSTLNHFDIENKMFEDQVHERDQFSLNFAGNTFKGIYHNGEITWFHPHPQQKLEDEHLTNIEEKVHERMQS